MNLRDKILKTKNESTVEVFKEKYPEVYVWFNSRRFQELMMKAEVGNGVAIRISTYEDGVSTKALGLPIQDSNGYVDMDEVVDYLRAEGFVANIGYKFVTTTDLMIRLK